MKKIGLILVTLFIASSLSFGNEESQKLALEGVKLFKQGEYDKALKIFTQATQADPYDAWAYNNLGLTQAEVGQFLAALKSYHKALNLAPQHCVITYNKGMAQHSKGDLLGSRETLAQWGTLCPENPSMFQDLEKLDNKFLYKK